MGFWKIIYDGNDPDLRLLGFWRLLRSHFSAKGILASDERLSDLPNTHTYPAPQAFPQLTRTFPSPQQAAVLLLSSPPDLNLIHAFEERLIDDALTHLTHQGPLKTRTHLQDTYALRNYEASCLIRLARREAYSRVAGTDLEEHRASFILRLNSYIDRARASLDLNRELQAMKLLSQALHITSAPPSTSNEQDFLDVIYSSSSKPLKQIAP